MKIALIAHDKKKKEMVEFAFKNKDILAQFQIIATGNTGQRISDETGLDVIRVLSGPYGGDQQIGAQVAASMVKAVIFLRDPLTAQPHEPDITALLRISDVHNIPLATNLATAQMILDTFRAEGN